MLIQVDTHDGVAVVTLNDGERRNVLSLPMVWMSPARSASHRAFRSASVRSGGAPHTLAASTLPRAYASCVRPR